MEERKQIARILQIWEERVVYPLEFIKELRAPLERFLSQQPVVNCQTNWDSQQQVNGSGPAVTMSNQNPLMVKSICVMLANHTSLDTLWLLPYKT